MTFYKDDYMDVIVAKPDWEIAKYHQEKPLTLGEFIEPDRLKAGQRITVDDEHDNRETFWIGHATVYHCPSTNDGGFGWLFDSEICKKYIVEVLEIE